ncbi:hypothetical protein P691DRAFT_852455, partial [Macrolepiota fuliginosa MF-IS2]
MSFGNALGNSLGNSLGDLGSRPPPADTRLLEERFQVQLQQLQDMRSSNTSQNVRALLATGGNVHAAVGFARISETTPKPVEGEVQMFNVPEKNLFATSLDLHNSATIGLAFGKLNYRSDACGRGIKCFCHRLDILGDQHLETTKWAAMITTALTWFFNNLPINILPIALHPPLLLRQHILDLWMSPGAGVLFVPQGVPGQGRAEGYDHLGGTPSLNTTECIDESCPTTKLDFNALLKQSFNSHIPGSVLHPQAFRR